MKLIPIALLDSLNKPGRSVCFLVRIECVTGEVFGFTNLNRVVRFDDGDGLVVYRAKHELSPMNVQFTADLEVDNTELQGWFDESMTELVLAGKFNNAKTTVYRINYLHPEYGAEVVSHGTIGKVEYSISREGRRKVDWRGYTDVLKDKKSDQFSLTCRNQFGDSNCGMPYVWQTGTIVAVDDNRQRFQVSGISQPTGHFDLGVVEFMSGQNLGYWMEIESWSSDGWLDMSFVSPFVIAGGVVVRLRQDCDKRHSTCVAYGNAVNMNAEHLTPVQDQSIMFPGAYVKNVNAL